LKLALVSETLELDFNSDDYGEAKKL